jgi:hypothetical protein
MMSDPHSVNLHELPEGWACMSLNGFAVGGTPEALNEVRRIARIADNKCSHQLIRYDDPVTRCLDCGVILDIP